MMMACKFYELNLMQLVFRLFFQHPCRVELLVDGPALVLNLTDNSFIDYPDTPGEKT
jgi:hypothetical protein